jgi:surface antigen
VAVVAAVALLAGCAGGFDLGRLDTDRSIITNAVPKASGQQPDMRASDEAAIRAAIAAWAPGEAPPDTVPWVNANTGSSGAISRVADMREGGRSCRTFTASRDSFSGSSRYRGKACIGQGGSWTVTDLNQG